MKKYTFLRGDKFSSDDLFEDFELGAWETSSRTFLEGVVLFSDGCFKDFEPDVFFSGT